MLERKSRVNFRDWNIGNQHLSKRFLFCYYWELHSFKFTFLYVYCCFCAQSCVKCKFFWVEWLELISMISVYGVEYQESLDHSDQMFKPGWKDIFRMNQNELESEIRKVYQDSTLDPRRKAYLVQNLMTRLAQMLIIYLEIFK